MTPIFFVIERLGKLSTEERRNNYFCDVKECKGINDIQTWSECYQNSNKTLNEKGTCKILDDKLNSSFVIII